MSSTEAGEASRHRRARVLARSGWAVPESAVWFDLNRISGLNHARVGQVLPPLSLGMLAGTVDAQLERPRVDVAVYTSGGVICQGPTGTGITALLAWLHQQITASPAAPTH